MNQEMPPLAYSPATPWYRRRGLIILIFALLMLSPFIAWVALKELTGLGCSIGEQAVLEEFPHYGNQPVRTYSAEVSCNARYTLQATRSEVLGYYDERLRENGWEAGGYWAANPPQGIEIFGEQLSDLEAAPEERVRAGLSALRGDYSYDVEYYPPGSPAASAEAGASEDEALVVVSVTDEPGPGAKAKAKGGLQKE